MKEYEDIIKEIDLDIEKLEELVKNEEKKN